MKARLGIFLVLALLLSMLPEQAPTATAQGVIAPGQTVSGTISSESERDGWTFGGNRGDRVTIRLNQASGSNLDPHVRLFAPSGTLEIEDDNGGGFPNSLINNWELRESGTYAIVARGLGFSTGAYTLSFSLIPIATPTPTPVPPTTVGPVDEGGPIASGQTVSGGISPPGDDRDNWTFSGNRVDTVTIRLNKASASGLDPYLELIAPSGGRETENNDTGSSLNSLINNWELRETGTYTIVARGYGSSTGAYALYFSLTPALTITLTPTLTITPTPSLVTNEFGTYIPYSNEAGETYALYNGSDFPSAGFVWIPIGQLTVEYIPIPASAWDGGIYAFQYAMMVRFNPAWITGTGSEAYSRFPSLSEISTLPQAMQDILLAEVTFQPSGGLNDGTDDGSASKGKDTYVSNTRYGDRDTNFGNRAELVFDYYYSYDGYPLLQFDVSTLPSDIASAKLYLYVTASCGGGSCPAMGWDVKSIASPWNEMTATWNVKPTLSGSYGTLNIPASPTGIANARWVSVDITTLYNGWKSGTITNYGVGFTRLGSTLDGGVWFNTIASSDYDTASLRPKLVIQSASTTTPIRTQLASLIASQNLRLVLTWDSSDAVDPWKLFDPSVPSDLEGGTNDLATLVPGVAYWIYVERAATVTIGSGSYQFVPGWNLLGFSG